MEEVGVIRQRAEAVTVAEMLRIMNVPLITLIGHVLNVFPHSHDYSNACFLAWKKKKTRQLNYS